MRIIRIEKDDWVTGLGRLSDSVRLCGPVKTGDFHHFKQLPKGVVPDLEYRNTRLSPKSLVYPQSEAMLEYTLDTRQPDHHIHKEIAKDFSPQALLGIRPCDAKAFLLVRRNFDTPQYKDTYWIRRYETTTFVGLACDRPCTTCFCTTAGSGPHGEEGCDVLLVRQEDGFLAKVLTPKGEALMETAKWQTEAESGAPATLESLKKDAEGKIVSHVQTEKLRQKETLELYEAPFWQDVAFSCINCGTCTYLCPTCWCFDIQDEVYGLQGMRMRNWDSCMYPLFTLHGSGHNPRPEKMQRVRQRFMHKLKYYVDRYENGIQCVGCGRCIQHCPVNIDIRKVCDLMNGFEPGACAT